jgi:hypothetical protein
LPSAINQLIKEQKVNVKVIPTEEHWFGMTYKEDRDLVVSNLQKLVDINTYPSPLWKQ